MSRENGSGCLAPCQPGEIVSEILTAETAHGYRIAQLGLHGRAAELTLHAKDRGGLFENERLPGPPAVPHGVAVGNSIPAWVSYGRWIVQCACGCAQIVSRVDPRAYCPNCLNLAAGGMFRPVVFPPEADAIEAILSRRHYDVNRNWLPGESVADLQRENDTHAQEVG